MTVTFVPSTFGGSIAVRDLSPTDRASGDEPALLFVHPVSYHGEIWRPVASRLAHRGRRFAIDQPGHGLSRIVSERPVDWHSIAADVLTVVDALSDMGIERPIGVGQSMGGAMLTIAEVMRPGTFRGLWLYEPVIPPTTEIPAELIPPPGAPARPMRRSVFDSLEAAYSTYRSRQALQRLSDESIWAYVEHGFDVRDDGSVVLRCDPEVEQTLVVGWTQHRVFDDLGAVRCPVHLVRGNLAGYQARWAAALVHAYPDAVLERQEQLTHLGPLEEPATIARSIDGAIERLSRPYGTPTSPR